MKPRLDVLLHAREPDGRPWKYLPAVLALAFAARAIVALSGDFVLHPDEIMQYLEPAHRLVFGNGVTYWEFFYGARSWIVPGAVAGVLKLLDVVGLGEPRWYVGAVKLMFCAISLGIPAGMYFFARRHFGEASARAALVAGAFWYELVGFAHKPMTEFVATVPLVALLALCVRPALNDTRTVWQAAFLAAIASAIRMQYAPLALVLLGIVFLRTGKKARLAAATAAFLFAVGVFDAVTWDAGLFHSYLTNLRFNLILGPMRAGESPPWQFILWFVLAGGGLSLLCVAASLRHPRRYGLLLALIALILLLHSLQAHKEYRFVFVVVPLWLLIGADVATRLASRVGGPHRLAETVAAVFAAVSLAGIMNALPYQDRVYRAWSRETRHMGFVRNQDPVFAAYRYLARAAGVTGVWQPDRPYYRLPGYYYLHRKIPFYDLFSGRALATDAAPSVLVSHIVSAAPALSVAGYSLDREFAGMRVLRRDRDDPPVRQWLDYAPTIVGRSQARIMARIEPDAPVPPANFGIRLASRERPVARPGRDQPGLREDR
ncbi:MAG: hypothetical protein OXU42_14915 [Deltaproteobacteria bacterium]|nr:hypothetical protein [Deltaproteobacteria bacterium]